MTKKHSIEELKKALYAKGETVLSFANTLIKNKETGEKYDRTYVYKVVAGINNNNYIAQEVAKKINAYQALEEKIKELEAKGELFDE